MVLFERTAMLFLYWPFGSLSIWHSFQLSPLQLWFHFFFHGFSITVAAAFGVAPILMGCAIAALLALHHVGPIRKMLGVALLVTVVPWLYPPMVVCLSCLVWIAISTLGIVFLYLGPVAVILGFTKKVMNDTFEFCAKQRQEKEPELQSSIQLQQELTVMQVVVTVIVAPISLLTTGAVIIFMTIPRAPFIMSNLYLLAVVRMWQCWNKSMREAFSMAAGFSVTQIMVLVAHIGFLLLWCISAILGIAVIGFGAALAILLLVMAAALWPAHVAGVAVKRQAYMGRCPSPLTPSTTAMFPTVTCQHGLSTKAFCAGAVYGSVDTGDDELLSPVLVVNDNIKPQHNVTKQSTLHFITTINKFIHSFPLFFRRLGFSFQIASVAAYQVIYVCNVLCNAGMKSWWDPHLSRRAVIELWQWVMGENGRLQFSHQMARDMSSMAQPSVVGLLKTRQYSGCDVYDWRPNWKQQLAGGTERESIWNGFWYEMNIAKTDALMRRWLTDEHILACPAFFIMGLPSVVMLQCCLRSVYKQVPLSELLLTTLSGETTGTVRFRDTNLPKQFPILDELWACLLEARKGCQQHVDSNFSVDHLVLALCGHNNDTSTQDDLVVWNGVPAEQLDPTEPLHKLFACLLAADEPVEDLPLDFQVFLKEARCVDTLDHTVNSDMIFRDASGTDSTLRRQEVDSLRKVFKNIRQASTLLAGQRWFQMAFIHHLVEPLDDIV